MAVLSFKVNGLDAAFKTIDTNIKGIETGLQGEMDAWAIETATLAKRNAPVDEGHLRNSINEKFGKLKASVTVNVNYAAYLEFGTRKFAAAYVSTLPQDWQSFAAQYKGSGGGNFKEFLKNITEWVVRKGIAAQTTKSGNTSKSKSSMQAQYSAAYMIALSILRKGIKPQPYLYPAYLKTTPELIKNIKALLQ